MKCKKAHLLIPEYVDECLNNRDCVEMELHLRVCERCAIEVEKMRLMLNGLGSLCGCKSPVDCWEHVRQRVADDMIAGQARWRWALRPAMAVPMFAVVLLLIAFLIWPSSISNQSDMQSALPVPEYTRYLAAHSRAQSHPAFADPDVTFTAAELESANLQLCGSK